MEIESPTPIKAILQEFENFLITKNTKSRKTGINKKFVDKAERRDAPKNKYKIELKT